MVEESERIYEDIGKIVIGTLNKIFTEQTEGNYNLNDYIYDFEGTQEELNIELIKIASKYL